MTASGPGPLPAVSLVRTAIVFGVPEVAVVYSEGSRQAWRSPS